MKPPGLPLILTHAAGALLGVCIACAAVRTLHDGAGAGADAGKRGGNGTTPMHPEPAGRGMGKPARTGGEKLLTSREYREAWDAIARRHVPWDERVEMQMRLLRQWSQVDLQAALEVAVDQEWTLSDGGGTREVPLVQTFELLAPCFTQAFRKDPVAAWDILHSGELRLTAGFFQEAWDEVFHHSPQAFIDLAPMMGQAQAEQSIHQAVAGNGMEDEAARRKFLARLAKLPPPLDGQALLLQAACSGDWEGKPADAMARVESAATETERAVAVAEYIASLPEQPDHMVENWAKLPQETRAENLERLLETTLVRHSPAGVADIAIAEGRLDLLENEALVGGMRSRWYGAGMETRKGAEWALTLPPVPQAEKIFRAVMRSYFVGEGGSQWLEDLPPGWHRTLALEVEEQMRTKR